MTKEEENVTNSLVEGIILFYNSRAKFLFDYGITHSFIAISFENALGLEPKLLESCLLVNTPMGENTKIIGVCRACVIKIANQEMEEDLIILRVLGYDVILRMDLISTYHATIDCFRRRVELHNSDGKVAYFFGDKGTSLPFLSLSYCFYLSLEKGGRSFLPSIQKDVKEGKSLQHIPIVNNFPDVFPEELPGLPPKRECDFAINVYPGKTTLSIAPYRMAPFELRELKNQLQDLQDKGFIQPSTFP